MLAWRLTLGTLFIGVLAGLCWLDVGAPRPGMYLWPLAMFLALLGAGELLAMFRLRGHAPAAGIVYGGVALMVLLAGLPVVAPSAWSETPLGRLGWLTVGFAVAFLLAAGAALRRFPSSGQATVDLALEMFAIVYVGGLMGFLVQLRLLGMDATTNRGRLGMLALLSLVLIVKLSDIGQYTVGRICGRHKLAPRVSPGKTWEGVLGGLIFAELGAVGTMWLGRWIVASPGFDRAFAKWTAGELAAIAIFPLLLAAAGIIGDLTESLLKRDAGVKDSSTWMPGFGGVLDLLDSLLGAVPVAYLFWAVKSFSL